MDFNSFKQKFNKEQVDSTELDNDAVAKLMFSKRETPPPPEIDDTPVVEYTYFEKKVRGKMVGFYMDEFQNMYDENFSYIDKTKQSKCRVSQKPKPKIKKKKKAKKASDTDSDDE
jgi:hypothetical protein